MITKTEKVVLGIGAVLLSICLFYLYSSFQKIEEVGGLKQVIIDVGREVKDINAQIAE